MVELEYNNQKIQVPTNWGEITLGEYETFYEAKPQSKREEVELTARICKVDPEILLSWPAEVFGEILDRIHFIFSDNPEPPSPFVEIDGVKYVVPIETELTLGAWVDADEVQKAGDKVLSNVLAIVCRPAGEAYDYRNNEGRAALFAAQPVKKIQGVLAFFLHYKTEYERRTKAFTALAETADQLPRSIKPFHLLGGGIKLSQTWRAIKYYVLMKSLHYQLRKFSRSYSTKKIKEKPKKHSAN